MDQTLRIALNALLTILPFVICWAASRGRPPRYALLATIVVAVLAPALALALWNVRVNTDSGDRDVFVVSLLAGLFWLSLIAAVVGWLGRYLRARMRQPARS